ncbi:MAG: MFS transporter [Novosphingobium sp.]
MTVSALPEDKNIPSDKERRPGPYAWYVVIVLMLAYTLSYIDRKMPFILVESIKHDLNLSDTQIGLLTGMMFAVIYAVAGIPLARIADRRSRKMLMSGAILVWSVLTAFGGFAANFWMLAVSRAGVAAGEAACTPAAHSLIADYIPRRFRSRAIGVYLVGSPLGALLGLAIGGWVNEMADWRMAMFALGLPGILLAALIFFTIREPLRSGGHTEGLADEGPGIVEAVKVFMNHPALRHLIIGMTMAGVTSAAFQAFAPAYIIRTFGLGTAEIGLTYGAALGISGVVGTLLGGVLGDRLRGSRPGSGLAFLSLPLAVGAIALLIGLFSNNYLVFLASVLVLQAGYLVVGAPSFAATQAIVSPRMHAVASAIILLGVSGVGLSIGPLLAGAISDMLRNLGPQEALRWALLVMTLPHLLAATHYLLAGRAIRRIAEAAS